MQFLAHWCDRGCAVVGCKLSADGCRCLRSSLPAQNESAGSWESETGSLTWLALTALLSDCLKEISPEVCDADSTPKLCLSDKRLQCLYATLSWKRGRRFPLLPRIALEMRQGNILCCSCVVGNGNGTLAPWPLHISRALLTLSWTCDKAIQLCLTGRFIGTDVTDEKWEAAQGSWFVWEKWVKDIGSLQTHTNTASFSEACGKDITDLNIHLHLIYLKP